jgi:hypothetical protein
MAKKKSTRRKTTPPKAQSPKPWPPEDEQEPVTLTEPDHLGTFDLRDSRGRLSKSPLKDLVLHNQEAYRHLLFLIGSGVHPVVAGSTIGIPPQTFRNWCNQGREAQSGLYFNFWNDITLAISRTVADASIEVRIKTPEKWLAAGSALEVFAPEELPVGSIQGQVQAPQTNQNTTINIVPPESIPSLAEALLQLRRFGINLDSPILEAPVEDEEAK